jgi:hypothetical protein
MRRSAALRLRRARTDGAKHEDIYERHRQPPHLVVELLASFSSVERRRSGRSTAAALG